MEAAFLMPMMVVYFVFLSMQISDLRYRLNNPPSFDRGLPYSGLSYPDTGVDFVDLELHRLNLLSAQSETAAWLAEYPPPDPPKLSRLDRVMVRLNSNMTMIFVLACAVWSLALLALILEAVWPHVHSFFDGPYGQPLFADEDPSAEAPSFIKELGFLVVFPGFPLVVLALISARSTAGSRAQQDYDWQVDQVRRYREKQDDIDSQLEEINNIRPLMHQLLRG